MKIRLDSGYLADEGKTVSDSVYDRPVMLVYVGKFESMDGPVDITESHVERLASEHNSMLSRVKRFASGEVPMREYPPVQLDHSPSAVHTVGRLVGDLSVGEADIDGEKLKALFGTVRFLGKENVEKAMDGRYTHVSIGADLESHRINELSVTPFPAAPKASLLSKKRLASYKGVEYEIEQTEDGVYCIYVIENGVRKKVADHAGSSDEVDSEAKRWIDHERGEIGMHDKMKKHLMEHEKMSEKDAHELAHKMHEHHMKHMGKSEEEMSKHLEAADDKELKRMHEDYDKHLKHLAEKEPAHGGEDAGKPEDAEKEKKMTAAKEGFMRLVKGIKAHTTELAADIKLSNVNARLLKLRASGKITPAEIKKIDVKKLAELSTEASEAALATFDLREPVIRFGLMNGTTKADAIQKVANKYRMAKLELESRLNMPSKKKEAEAMLAKLSEEEKHEMAKVGDGEEEEPSKGMLTKVSYEDLVKMLDEKDRHEELKKHLKHLVDIHGYGAGMNESDEKHMSSIAKRQTALQNEFNELISIVSPALGIKLEDIKA